MAGADKMHHHLFLLLTHTSPNSSTQSERMNFVLVQKLLMWWLTNGSCCAGPTHSKTTTIARRWYAIAKVDGIMWTIWGRAPHDNHQATNMADRRFLLPPPHLPEKPLPVQWVCPFCKCLHEWLLLCYAFCKDHTSWLENRMPPKLETLLPSFPVPIAPRPLHNSRTCRAPCQVHVSWLKMHVWSPTTKLGIGSFCWTWTLKNVYEALDWSSSPSK